MSSSTAVVELVASGASAMAGLDAAIERSKGGDALAPVTVVVPSHWAGLCLRRRLGASSGLLNVRFTVLAELLALLGQSRLIAAGRRPLTRAVRGEAVRALLAERPGPFGHSAAHPATVAAVDAALDELVPVGSAGRARVAAVGATPAHLIALAGALAERLTGWYGRHDLADAASKAVGAGDLGDVGAVILYLPDDLTGPEVGLFGALARATPVRALLPLTGDPAADRSTRRLAGDLAAVAGAAVGDPGPVDAPTGTAVVRAPDPEEEVREAARWAMAELEAGRPLHRLAILTAVAEPYDGLVHQVLSAAGIPHHGPAVRTLAGGIAGRTLLGALAVIEGGFGRAQVAAWLSGAPVLEAPDGQPAPAADWDRLARAANVVGGASWDERLGQHRVELERRLAERAADGVVAEDQVLGLLERLEAFLDELVAKGAPPPSPSTWSAWAAWAQDLLDRYLGSSPTGPGWTASELDALAEVRHRLDAFSALDDVGTSPDRASFRAVVERTLTTGGERLGAFGDGLFVGRLEDVAGMTFDGATVLGAAEGSLPRRRAPDALLDRHARAAAGGALATEADARASERRRYLLALASADRERRLSFPLADPRGQRRRLPSRWLLETSASLEGTPLRADEVCGLDVRPWLRAAPSPLWAVVNAEAALDVDEQRLAHLARWVDAGQPLARHPLVSADPSLARGAACVAARTGPDLSAWEGRVGTDQGLNFDAGMSATALQTLATCPFRFYLERVLRVAERDEPEEEETIGGRDRGTLVHLALQRLVDEVGWKPERPEQPWSDGARARLRQIVDELGEDYSRRGRTGAPVVWALEQRRLQRELQRVLDDDEAMRRELGVVPRAAELGFGSGNEFPMEVPLPSGRILRGRGRIDRVDLSPDEQRAAVFDYKTGKSVEGRGIEAPDDPTVRGTHLQPAFYALAAEAAYPSVTAPVRASYWYVSERGGFARHGFDLDEERRTAVVAVLDLLTGMIADGVFPARPGDETARPGRPPTYDNCCWCPYDTVCPEDRDDAWRRARTDPDVAPYAALAEPEEVRQ